MASRHPNPELRVVGSAPPQETRPDHEKLAETPFSGKARLRELEQLAKTARRVREDAERELANSSTSRAIAEQRISTCDRTIRKAEEEMAELRAELYHREQLDGEDSDFSSAEDFELAVLLGKSTREEPVPEEKSDDLALSPIPKQERRPAPEKRQHVPFRSVPRDSHSPKRDTRTRRTGFMLLVTVGAIIGASITYTLLQSPSIQDNVAAIATDPGQLLEEVKEAVIQPGTVSVTRDVSTSPEPYAAEDAVAPPPKPSAEPGEAAPATPEAEPLGAAPDPRLHVGDSAEAPVALEATQFVGPLPAKGPGI